MAIRVGGEGEMAVVVTARDEASAVVQKFADNTQASLAEAKKAGGEAVDAVGKAGKEIAGETKRAAGAVSPELDKWHGKAVAIGGALGTAAAALGTFALTATTFGLKNADAMGKLAKQAHLSTEQFSALAFHFRKSDVDAKGLSAMLFTMERNLGQAARTGKGVTDVVEGLGLKVGDLVKQRPDQAFIALAEALSKIEDPFQRAEAMQKVLGRSSREMAEAIEGGAEGIRQSMQRARELGVVISETTARDADQFFDNITEMSTSLERIGNTLAKGLSKDLVALSAALVKLVSDSTLLPALTEVLVLLAKGLLFVLKVVVTGALAAQGVVTNLAQTIGGLGAAAASLAKGEFSNAWTTIKEMFSDMKRNAEETREAIGKLWGLIEEAPAKGGKFQKSAFVGGQAGGFVRTGGPGMWSDVLPGAELVGTANEQMTAQEDAAMADREQREAAHQQRLLDSWQRMYEARQQFVFRYESLNLQSMQFFFGQLGALMTVKSKAMFNIGKAAAIAETIISTYKGAQDAFTALAGIPIIGPALGYAAAAAALIAGFARVQAIRATQMGGAQGSPVISGGGFSGPVVPTGTGVALPSPPVAGVGVPAAPAREVNVTLIAPNPTVDTAWVRDALIPQLNEAIADGVRLKVQLA